MAGIGLGLSGAVAAMGRGDGRGASGKRVGIIGLDTSHSTAFVEALNADAPDPDYNGYRIVAAYPWGSKDIRSSTERIPSYTEEVKKKGVEIVDSIAALLDKVDVVLLETNDGRPHLEQALTVMKAGKTLFIDKPVAGTLAETVAIFEAARKYKVSVFSASSLRYMKGMQDIAEGKTVGKVLGADAFSPAPLEPHHPDFFWYGIHGIETLITVMGRGCKDVIRIYTEGTDVVTGVWGDGRIGTFRGTRTGQHEYRPVHGLDRLALLLVQAGEVGRIAGGRQSRRAGRLAVAEGRVQRVGIGMMAHESGHSSRGLRQKSCFCSLARTGPDQAQTGHGFASP